MGRSRAEKSTARIRSRTLSSSSSSDFEFTICSSPHNASSSATALCPADDLFYKGKLLPLHLSPRLSMVRTLLLASSSTSSDTTTTTSASRDSSGSSSSSDYIPTSDSSRPTDLEDEFLKPNEPIKKSKYFSLAKISSVFKKEPRTTTTTSVEPVSAAPGSMSVKRMSASARDVFKKYIKKVKPLYEKLSSKPKIEVDGSSSSSCLMMNNPNDANWDRSVKRATAKEEGFLTNSFSGNLWHPRRRRRKGVVVSSCPSSMRSSPCHSGVLTTRTGLPDRVGTCSVNGGVDSSMEELQSAIQGAIAHCKNSMKPSGGQ